MNNKIINPETNRIITIGGNVYKRLVARGVLDGDGNSLIKIKKTKVIRRTGTKSMFFIKKNKKRGEEEDEDLDDDIDSEDDIEEDEESDDNDEAIIQEEIERDDEFSDEDANDLLVNLVDVACSVISDNFKRLGRMQMTMRKRALKALITKAMF